jgi:hypothetical protein
MAVLLCASLSHRRVSADDSEVEVEKEAKSASSLQPGWQASLFLGYGTNVLDVTSYPETRGAADEVDLGLGLGLRARYQLPVGLLFGLRFSHYAGAPVGAINLTFGQVEAGWALPLGPLRVELFASAGVQRTWRESAQLCHVEFGCSSIEQSNFGWVGGLGLGVLFPVAERYFLGANGETMAMPDIIGLAAYASAGVSF